MINAYKNFIKNEKVINFVNEVEEKLSKSFNEIDKIYEYNQMKVMTAFTKNKLSESHFIESTGYGYNDLGRDMIETIYADIFCAEDALVRTQIVSGTHAISLCMFAVCRPGDKILSINDMPYDTIRASIGLNNEKGSLSEYGVDFDFVPLKNGTFDYDNIKNKIDDKTKLIMMQRSRGYSDRKAFSISEINEVAKFIKDIKKDVVIMLDNCYGEFVDYEEPDNNIIDLISGSLIKNLGGGLAKSGGYIVGKKEYVELASYKLTAPGIGKEVGINFNQNRSLLQGLYFAPQMVSNAMKVSKLFTNAYAKLGFDTNPKCDDNLNDIVVRITLNDEKKLEDFCRAIQSASPVDSSAMPFASDMPGYDAKVIMAAGNFVQGSSLELSCDGPSIAPYNVYMQGGLSYYQGKLALMKTIEELNLL